jgi:hypothetical protein
MIETTAVIGVKRVTARCAQRVALQAQWVLDLLGKLELESEILRDGSRIELGWVILTVAGTSGEFTLLAPDFARDPFRDATDDLTVCLEVQAKQNDVLRRLGVEGETASFQDKVVIAKGALHLERVYLERTANVAKGDSGWYIGPVINTDEKPPLEAIYVFELLKHRPDLLQVLALPPGYLVVFDRDKIESILNSDDVDVWRSSADR